MFKKKEILMNSIAQSKYKIDIDTMHLQNKCNSIDLLIVSVFFP